MKLTLTSDKMQFSKVFFLSNISLQSSSISPSRLIPHTFSLYSCRENEVEADELCVSLLWNLCDSNQRLSIFEWLLLCKHDDAMTWMRRQSKCYDIIPLLYSLFMKYSLTILSWQKAIYFRSVLPFCWKSHI